MRLRHCATAISGIVFRGRKRLGRAYRPFRANFPVLVFQPSDPEPDASSSVAASVKATRVTNVRAAIALDGVTLDLADRIG